jgi:2-hydroxychromene-2-carboxylate isomerase
MGGRRRCQGSLKRPSPVALRRWDRRYRLATSDLPVLSFDLGSPYAYLAVARAESVLGRSPVLEPVLLGAIFRLRGHGSWAHTAQREAQMAEVATRARRYGLPDVVWPPGWPADDLAAMRAAAWAQRCGRVDAFARAAFAAQFARGADLTDHQVLAACAQTAGLDGDRVSPAIADPAVKQALRESTEAAWAAGVRGVPTLRIGTRLFYGDDQLQLARDAHAGS